MTQLTLGSLFDGIGGFPLAGIYAGMNPIWASEIEPFPIRVTRKRLPFMRHYGDIHKLHGEELEPVDVITFGSPCQNLSVAGKRAGLQGEQSSLFFEAVRIIKEMRYSSHGQYPKWAVWENVPGALSSCDGQDFRQVLTELVRIKEPQADVPLPEGGKWLAAGEILGDGYSLAWRTLDASKGWGVAQRRKRIFLVLDLAGQRAGKVLFESEGLSGYSPPGAETREGAAAGAQEGAGEAGPRVVLNDQGGARMSVTEDVTNTLRAQEKGHPPLVLDEPSAVVFENHSQDTRYTGPVDVAPTVSATYGMGGNNQPFVVEKHNGAVMAGGFCTEHSADSRGIGYEDERAPTLRANVVPGVAIEFNPTDSRIKVKEDGICQTLTARAGTGGNQTPLAMVPRAYGICADQSRGMLSDNPKVGFYEADTSRTLDCNGGSPLANQGGIAVVEPIPFTQNQRDEIRSLGNQSGALAAEPGIHQQTFIAVPGNPAYTMTCGSFMDFHKEVSPTLMARDYKDPPLVGEAPEVEYLVRRLTPDECCRLQGYPDGWCKDLIVEWPSEDEIAFWLQAFEEHRKATGSDAKPKTRRQIIQWLIKPGTDSAEYKAYGNSVAVPCVFFILAGIVWTCEQESLGNEADDGTEAPD